MDKYGKLFTVIMSSLTGILLFILYQALQLTDGGFMDSSEAISTLPLVVQADVSLIAFWGLLLVFRISQLSSIRTELVRNLWEIGFKRDELKMKIEEAKGDKEKREFLTRLHEELGKDATIRKRSVGKFYEWETMIMYWGLLAVAFFVVSICSGIYGIGMTFHTELVDPFTAFTPVVSLFTGVMVTFFALLSSSFRLGKNLEIR